MTGLSYRMVIVSSVVPIPKLSITSKVSRLRIFFVAALRNSIKYIDQNYQAFFVNWIAVFV